VRLAYMTCIVPALGGSAASSMAEVPEDSKIDLKIDVSSPPRFQVSLVDNLIGEGVDVSRLDLQICRYLL